MAATSRFKLAFRDAPTIGEVIEERRSYQAALADGIASTA